MESAELLANSTLPENLKPLLPHEVHVLEVCLSDLDLDEGLPYVSMESDKQPVRAEFLYWLATSPEMSKHIRPGGIRVQNAQIVGKLKFMGTEVPHALQFRSCEIPELANFNGAHLINLRLENCRVNTITADFMTTQASVFLSNGFKAAGRVGMVGATLGGNLTCTGGTFNRGNSDEAALDLALLKTNGSVFLDHGFCANGSVVLWSADIRGKIECQEGIIGLPLEDPAEKDKEAFTLEGAKIGADALLRDMKVRGKIRLNSANIEGILELTGSKIYNKGAIVLQANGTSVKRAILMLKGFEAVRQVQMLSAVVGAVLDCSGGKFNNPKDVALDASGISVGSVILMQNCFEAHGEVKLHSASVGGDLDCTGGKFDNLVEGAYALEADGISVKRFVLLRDHFEAKGTVKMYGASIGSDLDCTGGKFDNPGNKPSDFCLILDRSTVGGNFFWRGMGENPPAGRVSLFHVEVANMMDDPESWPAPGQLDIDGFVYSMFILPLILIGAIFYQVGYHLGAIQPTGRPVTLEDGGKPLPYPRFNPIVYSADVLLPIVDLHQEKYWEPNEEGQYGRLFVGFLWFQIFAGWFFTTVGAASVTGLIRQV